MTMRKPRRRTPFAVHPLIDCGRDVALVRYDGDEDTFTALAAAWLIDESIDRAVEPPQPRLYRCNPTQSDDYGWTLGKPSRPGPGTFLGAIVTLARHPGPLGEVARYECWRSPCQAKRGEQHLLSCPENWPVRQMMPGTAVTTVHGTVVHLFSGALGGKPWLDNKTGVGYTHDEVARMLAAGATATRPAKQSAAQNA